MIAALPRLHAVTDDRVVGAGAARVVERAAAMAGAAGAALAVHVRTRTLEGAAFLDLARRVKDAIAPHGSWLVVNDRADVARAALAQAIVTGRGGLGVRDIGRVAPGIPVARSVHDAASARAAEAEGADFLVAGAVFETASHPGAAVGGPELVGAAAAGGKQVVAIGGITPASARATIERGAWGVAAIRALWDAPDPAEAARAFVAALPATRTVALIVNGESRTLSEGTTLAGLLDQLGLDPRAVVVEHNRRIVRRDALGGVRLSAGDAVELIHFVGGG
ncbi:MAG TPA: sulfur carrier protein ThiS [Gemmatimonadales bacterium]|nr:sulfur carrier protein ThiS [Gemmatimonadales bacterium]